MEQVSEQWYKAILEWGTEKMIAIFWWLPRRIWPSRQNWIAHTSYRSRIDMPTTQPKQAFLRGYPGYWSTERPQQPDVFYSLDLGKERTICEIEFDHGPAMQCYPAKYKVFWEDNKKCIHTTKELLDGPIYLFFGDTSQRLRKFTVVIVEPNLMPNGQAYHWVISDIRFKEVRLKGLWKAVI